MIQKNIKIKEGTITVPVHQQGGSNSSQDVPSGTNIPQPTQNSNLSQQNNSDTGNLSDKPGGLKSKDDTIYLSAVERGDMETAQRMVDEAAEVFSEEAKKKKDTQLSVLRWSG